MYTCLYVFIYRYWFREKSWGIGATVNHFVLLSIQLIHTKYKQLQVSYYVECKFLYTIYLSEFVVFICVQNTFRGTLHSNYTNCFVASSKSGYTLFSVARVHKH